MMRLTQIVYAITILVMSVASSVASERCVQINNKLTDELLRIIHSRRSDCEKIPLIVSYNDRLKHLALDVTCYKGGDITKRGEIVARYDASNAKMRPFWEAAKCRGAFPH